jgi:two-component system, NarL family, response regulator DesR
VPGVAVAAAADIEIAPRLVIAQSAGLVREALEALLGVSGFTVLARCTRADELAPCMRAHAPDIVLVDADLADGEISELLTKASRGMPGGRVVLLAPQVDPWLALQTLEVAIDGVVLKCASASDVLGALRRIAAGDAVFPAGWLAAARRAAASGHTLSPRQFEVLELLAQGMPNDLIAERLFISRNTVKFHVAAIYQRLGVSNRVQAAQALATLRA